VPAPRREGPDLRAPGRDRPREDLQRPHDTTPSSDPTAPPQPTRDTATTTTTTTTTTPTTTSTTELHALHAKLKRTRRQAGDPSFRVLARLSPVQQSATTVSRMFNAPCPPSWPKLKGLLLALGVPAEQISTEWHALWTRAANEAHPIGKPDSEPDDELLTPVSYEDLACRKCGARIDDAALHGRFHLSFDRIADMVRLLERSAKRVAVPQRSV
jgi:hypothetical protein